jgi:hypothetical protein
VDRRPILRSVRIADPSERWDALGFTVQEGEFRLGGVTVRLGPGSSGDQEGIVAWGLEGIDPVDSIDGLATHLADAPMESGPAQHPNGALSIDHVVLTTPDFDRTSAVLAQMGMGLRRTREAPGGVRQGFRRLGPTILELVSQPGGDPGAPARFWGLVVVVADLDGLAEELAPHVGAIKDAVQPGRRIATLRASAGVSPAVAFMTPEPE